jgi:hypothetical protein
MSPRQAYHVREDREEFHIIISPDAIQMLQLRPSMQCDIFNPALSQIRHAIAIYQPDHPPLNAYKHIQTLYLPLLPPQQPLHPLLHMSIIPFPS